MVFYCSLLGNYYKSSKSCFLKQYSLYRNILSLIRKSYFLKLLPSTSSVHFERLLLQGFQSYWAFLFMLTSTQRDNDKRMARIKIKRYIAQVVVHQCEDLSVATHIKTHFAPIEISLMFQRLLSQNYLQA